MVRNSAIINKIRIRFPLNTFASTLLAKRRREDRGDDDAMMSEEEKKSFLYVYERGKRGGAFTEGKEENDRCVLLRGIYPPFHSPKAA